MAVRCWLILSAVLCAAAFAGAPSPPPPPDVPGNAVPDDEFLEFLGEDDVGDAAWWEFMKKAAPRKEQPPVPPPQDAKQ